MISKNNKNQDSKKFSYLPSDRITPIPIPTDQNYESSKKPAKKFLKTLRFVSLFLFLLLITIVAGSLLISQKGEKKKAENIPISTEVTNVNVDMAKIAPNISYNDITSNKQLFTIGKEDLYGFDLQSILNSYEPEITNNEQLTNGVKEKYLKILAEDSIILQEAKKHNLTKLYNSIFNSPNKDYRQRNRLIRKLKIELKPYVLNAASIETVNIYFNNAESPKDPLSIAQNKQTVKEKMDTILLELQSGTLTMEEAGQKIDNDSSLTIIDPAYQNNSYSIAENFTKKDYRVHDPNINNMFWEQEVGTISPVILGYTYQEDPETNEVNPENKQEAYYRIVKVNERNITGFETFDEWLAYKKTSI